MRQHKNASIYMKKTVKDCAKKGIQACGVFISPEREIYSSSVRLYPKLSEMLPVEYIAEKIYMIRGQKVMLDRDLTELYGVETRALNQAVTRNLERFPNDFMFPLTRDEILRISQNVTSSNIKYAKRVLAFAEQGVAMLSSVLRSRRAIEVNISIMRAFVQLRGFAASHRQLADNLSELEKRLEHHDDQIQLIFDAIKQLMTSDESPKRKIGFTVKEKVKAYGKSGKKLAANGFSLTPQARRRWEAIPGDIRMQILNNVWCVGCRNTTGIGEVSGKIEKGMLVLKGVCTKCGGEVARVVE